MMLIRKSFYTNFAMLLATSISHTSESDNYSNTLFDVVCISLARATDRRSYITSFLSSMNLNYRLFNAVDGTAILKKEQHISQYSNGLDMDDMVERHLNVGRKCHGAVGLKFSNYILMNELEKSKNNKPALILEDDVGFDDDLVEIIENMLVKMKEPWDIILLTPSFSPDPSRPLDPETGLKGMIFFYGTYGFIINGYKTAKKLARYLEDCPIRLPIDDYYGALTQQGKLIGYAFEDSLIRHRSDLFKSTIDRLEPEDTDTIFNTMIYPFKKIAKLFN